MAGGRSTRMGTDKALLRIGGELLIERQLRCLREAGAEELLISGRTGAEYAIVPIKTVYDRHPDSGPLAGLAAILDAAAHELVLVLAVDMPAMNPAMLRKIVSLSKDDFGCIPMDEVGYQPLAAVYPKAAFPLATRQLLTEHYSMQNFARSAIAQGLAASFEVEPAERVCFTNWNRRSDWTPTEA